MRAAVTLLSMTLANSAAPLTQNTFRTTELTSFKEIDGARALLYRVYHEEQGWSPPLGNWSAQKPELLQSGELGFVDRYDHTCTWVGLSDDGRVVGCVRLIDRRDNGFRLELENYFTLPKSLLESAGNLLEVNRLALAPEYRRGQGMLMITSQLLSIALRTGKSLIATGGSAIAQYAVRHVGMTDTGLRFTYHADDREAVSVLVLENRGTQVASQWQAIQRRLASTREANSACQ
jgi:N-acyl-L-homoserine lactone synthetase